MPNNEKYLKIANSHAYGVILTHLTCYSRTHAIDKFIHAFLKITRILTQLKKIENNLLYFDHCNILFMLFLLQNHIIFVASFIKVFPVSKSKNK